MLLSILVPAQPTSAEDAVRIATATFEYRDFEKVIELLDPFVHPPRITDPKLLFTARELLGVSRHVTGDLGRAKEEFAQMLLAEPEYKLDAFKIPPQVIETFEGVRREMKPVLDKVLAERGRAPKVEEKPLGAVLVDMPTRFDMFMPLGIPQFRLDEPIYGAIFLITQLIGVAVNVAGYFIANDALHSSDLTVEERELREQQFVEGHRLWAIGAGVTAISWITSSVLGNTGLEGYRQARQRQLAPDAAAKPAGLLFQLQF